MASKVIILRDGLTVDGIVEKAVSPDQSKYVNSLEIRLKSYENDVKSKETQLLALQTKLDKQVSHENYTFNRRLRITKMTVFELKLRKQQSNQHKPNYKS